MSNHPYSRFSLPLRGLLIVTIALLAPLFAFAQERASVTGTVLDNSGQPIQGATARLRDASDSTAPALGAVTTADGKFRIANVVVEKRYRLEVTFLGTEPHVQEVIVREPNREQRLGEIRMKPKDIGLGEVEVTAERSDITIKADKTVHAIENNPTYTATNVSELLGQVPQIQVDQDGNVSLRGESDVTIMVNDRPLTMTGDQRNKYLQSLPASMVKDIEIRTNPGAQYDAKNQGGIINIVTRRTMTDMLGANITAGGDSRPGGYANGTVYYKGSGLNASIGGSLYRGGGQGSYQYMRLNYLDTHERRDIGSGTTTSSNGSTNAFGQLDYSITENDVVSFSFNYDRWGGGYQSLGEHTFFNADDVLVGRYYDTTEQSKERENSGGRANASLLLKHTFSGDHKIRLDINYSSSDFSSGSNYTSAFFRPSGEFDAVRSSLRSSEFAHSEKAIITALDYENPISDTLTLSFGAKNEINKLDNRTSISYQDKGTGEFVLDTLQSNHFLPDNSIYALYGNVAYKLSDALTVQAGLRMEAAKVSATYATGAPIIARNYTNFFPSGSLAFNITPQQSITASYRRSVALPDIDALNPTKLRWSDFHVYSGNPDLEPEFTQSFQVNYNAFWSGGSMFSISPYYTTTRGNIERSEELISGVTYSKTTNFNGTYSLGSEISLSMRPASWTNFRVGGNVYQKVNRGGPQRGDVYSSATGYSGNATFNADLMEGLTLGMNLFFNMPPRVGEAKQSGHTSLGFSLRQRLLDNKLTITLRANDPFDMQKWHRVYDTDQFYNESTHKWTSRFVGLNLSYTFGTTPNMETHKAERTETKGGGGSGGGGQ